MPYKALVTGGAGFVGHHLVNRLLEEGHTVAVLDDLSSGFKEQVSSEASFFEGSICSKHDLRESMEDCDVVYHLAAEVELQKSLLDPAGCLSANACGTANVIMETQRIIDRRLVFASSCALYPLIMKGPLSVEMGRNGETPYALSKSVGEELIKIYSALGGLNACVLRCFNIYGKNQRSESDYAAVVSKFLSCAASGKWLPVYGTGEQTRDFIHVDDVVDAYLVAGQSKVNGVFNVGTGIATSILKLAQMISNLSGSEGIKFFPARKNDAHSSIADMQSSKAILGFKPKITLIEGLTMLIDEMNIEYRDD